MNFEEQRKVYFPERFENDGIFNLKSKKFD